MSDISDENGETDEIEEAAEVGFFSAWRLCPLLNQFVRKQCDDSSMILEL